MPRELIHIRNNKCLSLRPTGTAYAFSFLYARTCNRTLERAKHKFITLYQVEAYPQPAELFLQCSGNICQVGNEVGLAFKQTFYLWKQGFIHFILRTLNDG